MKDNAMRDPRIGRRRFLQIIAVAGAAGALYRFGVQPEEMATHVVRESRSMMGTEINLIVCGPDADGCRMAISSTFERMGDLTGRLSRHDIHSELSRLNSEGQLTAASSDLRQVLALADEISQRTDGAFDVTVLPLLDLYAKGSIPSPAHVAKTLDLVGYKGITSARGNIVMAVPGMGITLDGIGKGYIVDQGVAALKAAGFPNVYVEAGGDLAVTGTKPAGQPWRIGIRSPRPQDPNQMVVVKASGNLAVATSGDYMQFFSDDMRHHHIIDPRSGISPAELASATVTAPTVAMADGLATAAMVLGPEQAMQVVETMDDCEGYFVDKGLRQYRTSGFQG